MTFRLWRYFFPINLLQFQYLLVSHFATKCVNCNKMMYNQYSIKLILCGDIFYIIKQNMPDVENFRLIHIYHVKTSQIFPKCGENFRNLHIYCVEKSEISPHDRFFLHKHNLWYLWQIWGPRILGSSGTCSDACCEVLVLLTHVTKF